MATIRKDIREYIIANGPSTAGEIVEDCILKGAYPDRAESILAKMTDNGKLIKSGSDYDIAP
jgi:hypothetical protein